MDPFATLGLERRYDVDRRELETKYRQLQRALHPDRHASGSPSERRLSLGRAVEVNEAYRLLRDDLSRAEALLKLLGAEAEGEPADPEFLMQIMELRESLSDARDAQDLDAVNGLTERVRQMQADADGALKQAFGALSEPASADALGEITALVARLRYYRRFMDEVTRIEEEALD